MLGEAGISRAMCITMCMELSMKNHIDTFIDNDYHYINIDNDYHLDNLRNTAE